MKVIKGVRNIGVSGKGSIVTIGVFDGVHLGHRKILNSVVRRSRRLGLDSVVLTFYPHPMKVLYPDSCVPSLVSLEHRIELIRSAGLDKLIILNFTRGMSKMPADRFVKDILVDRLHAKEVYTGRDFSFGYGAKAGVRVLTDLSEDLGFRPIAVDDVKLDGSIISSSLIRRLIMKGDIAKASKCLGRPVSILGTVVRGDRRGKGLGFPTANIDPHHEAVPRSGVYAVKIRLGGRLLKGVVNIGTRPTYYRISKEAGLAIEAHIFGFNGDIYGKDLELIFVKRIRDELRFKNELELVSQIRKDISKAKNILR